MVVTLDRTPSVRHQVRPACRNIPRLPANIPIPDCVGAVWNPCSSHDAASCGVGLLDCPAQGVGWRVRVKPAIAKIHSTEPGSLVPQDAAS